MTPWKGLILVLCAALAATAVVVAPQISSEPAKPVSGPPPGIEAKPAFADEFEGDRLMASRWAFTYARPDKEAPTLAKRSLYPNHERQLYFDREFLGLGIDPFAVNRGILTIQARPLTEPERAIVASEVRRQPPDIAASALRDVAYASGMISSRGRFSQTYGYFEIRARWSKGKGVWPAFWLLPADGSWPPEIDVLEAHGDKPGITYQTLHSDYDVEGTHTIGLPADDGQFHTYGMLWQADRISWYVDDRLTASEPTPADMHQPMFVVANLAIGGKWPGDPDSRTPFPATMEIDYIRAWTVAPRSTAATSAR